MSRQLNLPTCPSSTGNVVVVSCRVQRVVHRDEMIKPLLLYVDRRELLLYGVRRDRRPFPARSLASTWLVAVLTVSLAVTSANADQD